MRMRWPSNRCTVFRRPQLTFSRMNKIIVFSHYFNHNRVVVRRKSNEIGIYNFKMVRPKQIRWKRERKENEFPYVIFDIIESKLDKQRRATTTTKTRTAAVAAAVVVNNKENYIENGQMHNQIKPATTFPVRVARPTWGTPNILRYSSRIWL